MFKRRFFFQARLALRRDEHLLYVSGLGTWSCDLQLQLRLQQPRMRRESVTWHRLHQPVNCLRKLQLKFHLNRRHYWIRIGVIFIAKVMRLTREWKKLQITWIGTVRIPSLQRLCSQDLSWHSQRSLEDMCFGCWHLCDGFHQPRGTRKPGSCRFLAKVSTESWIFTRPRSWKSHFEMRNRSLRPNPTKKFRLTFCFARKWSTYVAALRWILGMFEETVIQMLPISLINCTIVYTKRFLAHHNTVGIRQVQVFVSHPEVNIYIQEMFRCQLWFSIPHEPSQLSGM